MPVINLSFVDQQCAWWRRPRPVSGHKRSLCRIHRNIIHEAEERRPRLSTVCVCVCVLFLQTVIVIPLAQKMFAVMAQDIVNVRKEQEGLNAMSVCRDICGTMAANVSRTFTQHAALVPRCLSFSQALSPSLPLSLLCLLLLYFG